MDNPSELWRRFFRDWPAAMPQRGLVVTSFDELVPFAGFLVSEAFLLLIRQTPDAAGARSIVISYDKISAVKLTDIVKPKLFESMGFEGSLPNV